MRMPSPTNRPQVYRALLSKPVEPIDKYAHTQYRWTPPIEHKCTEPYYTKEALPQKLIPHVQRPTTPNQYYLLTNEEALPH